MIEFEPVLTGLCERRVPFVVVGALALGPNAAPRATEDIDILVPADKNAMSAIEGLLREWGATRKDGTPLPESLFDGEHGINAMTPHGRFDILIEGESPLTYEEIAADAHRIEFAGHTILVAGLAHLTALKRLAGRSIDRWDLERLREAHGELPETKPPMHGPTIAE